MTEKPIGKQFFDWKVEDVQSKSARRLAKLGFMRGRDKQSERMYPIWKQRKIHLSRRLADACFKGQ